MVSVATGDLRVKYLILVLAIDHSSINKYSLAFKFRTKRTDSFLIPGRFIWVGSSLSSQ